MSKATKQKAHYRAGNAKRCCKLCTMFRPPHGCTAVFGAVSATGLCDYFERKDKSNSRDWYEKKE